MYANADFDAINGGALASSRAAATRLRAIGRAAERGVRAAGPRACNLSLSQHRLLLEEIVKLYDIASWIEDRVSLGEPGSSSRRTQTCIAEVLHDQTNVTDRQTTAGANPPQQD